MNVSNTRVATINASGIYSNTGTKMIGYDGTIGVATIANTSISGVITGSQIANASINAALITSNTITSTQIANGSITRVSLDTLSANGTGAIILPGGTDAQKPAGANGAFRFNSTNSALEFYANGGWNTAAVASILPSQISTTWSYPAVVNAGLSTNSIDDSNYYGARMAIIDSVGTSSYASGSYEYGIVSKYSIRTSSSYDTVIQLYGFGGTASSFAQSNDQFFQWGVEWYAAGSSSVLSSQTNSMNQSSSSAPPSGYAAWFMNAGVGTNRTWHWMNGGGAAGGNAITGTNREGTSNYDWPSTAVLTLVIKSDTVGISSRRIALFVNDTQLYKWTTTVPVGTNNIYWYFGNGYPNGSAASWQAGLPKFRYSNLTVPITVT
jgi:hypothetical protein